MSDRDAFLASRLLKELSEIARAELVEAITAWTRRKTVEKNGGYGLERNFCNKARVSRNIYLLMQIAHNLWQLFNRGCLLPLQKARKNRNMTQKKWNEILLQKLIAYGIRVARDEVPLRYLSREFLTS